MVAGNNDRRVAELVAIGIPPVHQGQELGKLFSPAHVKQLFEALKSPKLVFIFGAEEDTAYRATSAIIEFLHSKFQVVNQLGLRSLFRHRAAARGRHEVCDGLDKMLRDPEILSLTSYTSRTIHDADPRDLRWIYDVLQARTRRGKATLIATNLRKGPLAQEMQHFGLGAEFEASLTLKVAGD
jgi:hypothetical protein